MTVMDRLPYEPIPTHVLLIIIGISMENLILSKIMGMELSRQEIIKLKLKDLTESQYL